MIHLNRVATFLAVAACGGFREAAKQTGLSQSAVTQHVKRLERALNVNLINRSNVGSTLTLAGQTFLPYAENLIKTFDRAKALFEKCSVAVGASSNIGIYLLQPYLKAYKEISTCKVELIITDNPAVADKLERFEIDVAIMEWWDHRPGFAATVWRQEELVVIVPKNHPWAHLRSIPRTSLWGHDLLGGEAGTGTGRILQEYLGGAARSVGVSMQLGSTEAVKNAVRAGLGISLVMASSVEHESRNGELCAIQIDEIPPRKKLYVIRRESREHDAPALAFANFLLRPECVDPQ